MSRPEPATEVLVDNPKEIAEAIFEQFAEHMTGLETLHAIIIKQAETIAMLTSRLAAQEEPEESKPRGTL